MLKQLSGYNSNMIYWVYRRLQHTLYRRLQHTLYLVLSYMDTDTLDQLAAKLDERQKLVDNLATGMQKTDDLIFQLQTLSGKMDDKFTALTQQIADDTRVSDLSLHIATKNAQLSGLVQKLGTTVTTVLPKSS